MESGEKIGLSTNEALGRLLSDLKSVLEETSDDKNGWLSRKKSWLYDTLHHHSQYTTICWTSATLLLICILALSIASSYGYCENYDNLFFDILVVFSLLVLNLFVVGWDNNLRNKEILTRAKELINDIEKSKNSVKWNSYNYPHLCSPTSPCITLQWTYRDGEIVNLPWALLVKGDVIIVRPGQASPGLCLPFDDKNSPALNAHEIYSPSVSTNESLSLPAARAPLKNKKYVLQETPYLRNLRVAFDQSIVKPISYHNKERHLIMVKCVEQTAVPVLVALTVLINCMRYFYLDQWFGKGDLSEMLIIQSVSVALPLLPLIFPVFWFLLNAYGMTRIRAILQQSSLTQVPDPFEDTDIGDTKEPIMKFKFHDLRRYFFDVLVGRGPFLTRSVNILHVLGSVTALCCVDKKGILSWPNPTAEKVFFLRNSVQNNKSTESLSSECYNSTPQKASGQCLPAADDLDDDCSSKPFTREVQTVAEVLDLTHDHSTSFRLQFDDPSWKQHLGSLKPLGLAILLNTCNMATQEHYAQFCSHITCEAIHNEDLVPVTNRRCLCELAKQIGFIDQAQDIFSLEEQLCTFKHVQTDSVKRDIKFARQLSISTKLKFPFPHMMATVVREKKSGCLQLMSQGTAEVILDSCVDYWDGQDLYPLTPADRKKIIDFYQRSSLTAYCTAFAYRPLSKGVNSKLSHVYLELPADSKHLYLPHRSPTPVSVCADNRWKGILAQFHSTDSLLNMDFKEEQEEVADIDGCFELQCNQIFIGMVTMQYQAQSDIVQLIEQLERACIRFVHFSKENELRSRVFSEKMGLESGWNCHISLLSDRNRSESGHSDSWVNLLISRRSQLSSPLSAAQNCQGKIQFSSIDQEVQELNTVRTNLTSSRAMSFSAPSAINLELSTVKFDGETARIDWMEDAVSSKPPGYTRDKRPSEDSVIFQSADLNSQPEPWRSLSCLTDSTDQSVPVNFDIWNRAKLPRGIDNIRPHLDLIDNVPLLVSLFTDCTPVATKEMLHIMQDYGEVVCVMGSSANCENIGIFMQADASIAVEPLYPQVCQKVPAFSASSPSIAPSPIELSRALNAIACAVSLRREDPFSIYHLIMEARHYTQCLMNCLQFWVCSMVALSFLQFVAVFLMLPPLFSIHQVLYISCALIPILSFSLVALPTNSQVMQKATGKNRCKINSEVFVFVLWCYGSKFIPSVFIIVILYSTTMACFCNEIARATDTTCTMIYPNINVTKLFLESLEGSLDPTYAVPAHISESCWKGWSYFQFTLLSVQHLCAFSFVLHIAATSSSFVHRDYTVWQKLPTSNCLWLVSVLIVVLMQGIFSTVELSNASNDIRSSQLDRFSLPWYIFVMVILSPVIVFLINESVKWHEIKVNKRFQRRKRLDFGTKLGMNSPF